MDRKPRVMIFDDDPGIRGFLEKLLERKGCEVLAYESPRQCRLQQAHECHCDRTLRCADILITDVDMPEVSGIDFVTGQIEKGCRIQNIAIMSGAWSEANMQRARALGCAVFQKPVSLAALAEWLAKCMEGMDLQKDLSDWFLDEGPKRADPA